MPNVVGGLQKTVHIIKVLGPLEHALQIQRDAPPCFGIGSVNLGHDRLQNRGARRHFDHLNARPGLAGHRLQQGSGLYGNFMAGTRTL